MKKSHLSGFFLYLPKFYKSVIKIISQIVVNQNKEIYESQTNQKRYRTIN